MAKRPPARNLLARFVLGAVTGSLLLLVGIDMFSWRYWVIVIWSLIQLLLWSSLDKYEEVVKSKDLKGD